MVTLRIKSCEVRKWIKALTLDKDIGIIRAAEIYTIELKDIDWRSCGNTLKYSQESQKEIWHHTKGTRTKTVEISQNNVHQCPASGKNVASATKRIVRYNVLTLTKTLSVMEEIRSQGKILTEHHVKEICHNFLTRWRLQIRWWTTVFRSRQWSYQIPGGASAKGRWELWVSQQQDHANISWL